MKENYKNAESLGIALDLIRSPLKKFQISSNNNVQVLILMSEIEELTLYKIDDNNRIQRTLWF